MGMFDRIETVQRQFDNNFLKQGVYLLRIDEIKSGSGRKGEHWRFSATVVAAIDNDEGKGHRVGESVKRIRPQSQDGALPEFKSLVCCLFEEEDETQITKAVCEEVTGANQPATGLVIEVSGTQVETKASTPGAPRFFTRVDYRRLIAADEVEAVIGPQAYAKFFPVSQAS